MPRNKVMGAIGLVSLFLLVAAAVDSFRAFSYLAALLIVGVIASASVERRNREIDLAPYTGLAGGLLASFLIGLTAIWLLWTPGQGEFRYVLGVPASTLAYLVFLWVLPTLASVYYALSLFPAIGSDEVVDDIADRARTAQADADRPYPLAPDRIDVETDPRGGDD